MLDGPTIAKYSTLYITDPHVSAAATAAITDWVAAGGTLYATASGGLYDHANAVNTPMQTLLGLQYFAVPPKKVAFATPVVRAKLHRANSLCLTRTHVCLLLARQVEAMKRDLPTAVALDTVHLSGGLAAAASAEGMGAYGAMLRPGNISAKVLATNNMSVLATYQSDGTPAATHRRVGEGQAVAIAFLPSLAYFKPSLPNRPIDICPRDGAARSTRADSLRWLLSGSILCSGRARRLLLSLCAAGL